MIYFPQKYGTCAGAKRAINTALLLKNEYEDKKIYIYKEILHNEYIINYLKERNIICIDDLNVVNKGDLLVIRAHGESKKTFDYLKKEGITYYDATCTNVVNIHDLVSEKYNLGYKIIIVGKKEHPEVIGTNGWCNNEAIIISDKKDLKLLNKENKYFVIAQTTISDCLYKEIIEIMNKEKYNFIFEYTICEAQKNIQTSSLELAKKMDVMFVIGGKNSSNTKELFNVVSALCKSYYFDNIKDYYKFIKTQKYTSKTKIGFTGGASTLKSQIDEYSNLLTFYINYKEKVKSYERLINKVNNSFIKDDNKIIVDAVKKFNNMNNGGKYLRGFLIDLGYKLSKKDNYADYLSIAYETFQTSILIHDDIIDNAIVRRGKDTIPYTYSKEFDYLHVLDNTPSSLGICIGDLGIFYTNQIMLKYYRSNKNFIRLFNYYNDVVINTIKGELLDVYLPFKEQNDKNNLLEEKDIKEIYKLKTSWYSIVGPFCLGMILSGNTNKKIHEFEHILEPLGLAFQIKDDILGIFSKSDVLGKSVTSDIEEFKQTILYSYIKIHKNEYLDELLKYYGKKNITQKEALRVQEIFIESGSLEYAQNVMSNMFKIAKNNIFNLKIKEEIKNILLGLIIYLDLREK